MENSSTPSSQPTRTATSWFSGIVRGRSATLKRFNSSSAIDTVGVDHGPINDKHQFQGIMFKYGSKPIQVAFKTGDYKQQVIFIGGLTHGFLATEYLEPLAVALAKERWSLVQFLFSSSYSGYGVSSLKQDSTELDQLLRYFIIREESEAVILLGHGTGCQDVATYLRSKTMCSSTIRAAILQAPVSDREYRAALPETASMIDLATKMIKEDRASELMPTAANPNAPITAYRYYSLCGYNGDDDLFSSDFSESQLKQKLGHMSKLPTVVMFSMADEFVPHSIDKRALVDRLCSAMGAEKVEIERGNHTLSNKVDEAVQAIMEVVKRDQPEMWEDPWS